MKKFMLSMMTMLMLLSIVPVQAGTSPARNTTPTTALPAEVTVMLNRLDEIKAMDLSALPKAEKKELRKEVKSIKSDLKAAGQGVYLSVAAIVLIVLLLILLL